MPELLFAPGDFLTIECPHLFEDEAAGCRLCNGGGHRELELNVAAALIANAAAHMTAEVVNVQLLEHLEPLAHKHHDLVPRSEIFGLIRMVRERVSNHAACSPTESGGTHRGNAH